MALKGEVWSLIGILFLSLSKSSVVAFVPTITTTTHQSHDGVLFFPTTRIVGSRIADYPTIHSTTSSPPHHRHQHPHRRPPTRTTARPYATASSVAAKAFQSSGVQKVLELAVVVAIGSCLRDQLDIKATTAILLNALVPAVIVCSLSILSLSAEMGLVLLAGVLLALIQLVSGELASRFVIPLNAENEYYGDNEEENKILQRTAALQLGTMAPGTSVFSFTREFVGVCYTGFAALADLPTKLYSLLLIPYYLRFRGEKKENSTHHHHHHHSDNETACKSTETTSLTRRISHFMKDPFNLAIASGITLAALGRPITTLGFFGRAITSLAKAQTAILFLLIGLKLKLGGDRPKLCLRLLLARHGFCSLAVSGFLALLMGNAGDKARLASVLSSHAACSIIAFGQMSKVSKAGTKGYDLDLAFDIVALSFPFTVMLNTIACLAGSTYVNLLPIVGAVMLALSVVIK